MSAISAASHDVRPETTSPGAALVAAKKRLGELDAALAAGEQELVALDEWLHGTIRRARLEGGSTEAIELPSVARPE
jgi:hypothetical protein